MRGTPAASLAFAVVVTAAFAAAVAAAGGCAAASRGACPTPHLPKGLLPLSSALAPDLCATMRKDVHCGTNARLPHVDRRILHTLPPFAVLGAKSKRTLAAALPTALNKTLAGTVVFGAAHPVTSRPAAEAATGSTSSSFMPVRLSVPHARFSLATLPPSMATTGAIISPPRCPTASTKVAAALTPVPSALHLPEDGLAAHAAIFSGDARLPLVEPRPDSMPIYPDPEDASAAVHAACLAERCADVRTSQLVSDKRTTVEHVESPNPCCIPCCHQPSQLCGAALATITALDAAWGGRRSCSSSLRSVSDVPRAVVGGAAAQDRIPVELAVRVPPANETHAIHSNLLLMMWTEPLSSRQVPPATLLNGAKHLFSMTPAEPEVSVFLPPPPVPDGAPRPVLVLMYATLLCSPWSTTPSFTSPPPVVVLSATALPTKAPAAPICTHITPSTGEGVTVRAPPWSRAPTDMPTFGVVSALEVTMDSSGVGLLAMAAKMSGVNVAAAFGGDDGVSGVYSAACTTPANDTVWPWGGLKVDAALCFGATDRATVASRSTWNEESGAWGMLALPRSGACNACVEENGVVDFFVAMASTVANQLRENDGSGVLAKEGASRGVAGGVPDAGCGCGFGEADDEGWVDQVAPRDNDDVIELSMNDDSTGGGARGVSAGDASYSVSWGDVDDDSGAGLLVCGYAKRNRLFMNDGAGGRTEDGVGRGVGTVPRNPWQSARADVGQDVPTGDSNRVGLSPRAADGLWKLQPAFAATPRLGAAPQPASLASLFLALAVSAFASSTSQRRATQPFLPRLVVGLCLVWAVSASSPTCTRLTAPPNDEVVTVCAPPWPRAPTAAPTAGDSVTVDVTFASSTTGLLLVSAEVNGVDVGASFSDGGGGVYSVTHTIGVGDEDWPWAGLEVGIVLSDAGGGLFAEVDTTVVPGTTWTEESDARGMAALANGDGRGVCMGDVDGDGDVDVFVAMNAGTVNQLWVNDGSGVFTDEGVARGTAGDASDRARGCGFGDADGDGWVDLVVTRFANDVIDLYVNGGGKFVEDGEARGVSAGDDSAGVSWGDVDGDGDVDLFVCGTISKRNRLFMNDGAGMFTEEGVGRGVGTLTRNSIQSALVDIDGDGDLDVLVLNGGANELYVNGGDGNFTEAAVSHGFADAGNGHGVSLGDWSGDGVVDVCVTNYKSRDLLLLNDGGGVFSDVGVGAGIGASTGSSYGVVTFDIENDGDVDVVVGVWADSDYVWLNDGLGGFVDGSADLALGSSAFTQGVSAGDIDGDSDVDVIMGESGKVYVSHSAQGGVGRSVVVRPLTAGGAQSAFGASVRVECVGGCEDGWVGVRVIDGGRSFYSQNGYDAVVGVPVPSVMYNMSVRWAGDFRPQSNWTTHPRLGGVVPSTLTSVEHRLFIVRPAPLRVLSVEVSPWDYPGVACRLGKGPSPPTPGDAHNVTVVLSNAMNTQDVVVTVEVNGQDVSSSWERGVNGLVSVIYVTEAGDEDWPWSGLTVDVSLEDSAGLKSDHSAWVVPGSTWSEEAAVRGMPGVEDNAARGVCMADVDGDSDVDVLVVVFNATNQLWVNAGTGFFTDMAAPLGVEGLPGAQDHGCGFADVDGDGQLDLLVTQDGSDLNLYMNSGVGFADEAATRGLGDVNETRGIAWGDVDGDGDVDLGTAGHGTLHRLLFINDGSGVFTEEGARRGLHSTGNCSSIGELIGFADLNGDGSLDAVAPLASASISGASCSGVFLNNGTGWFTPTPFGLSRRAPWHSLALSDFNGDGAIDMYLTSSGSADYLYVNDAAGNFTEIGLGYFAAMAGMVAFDVESDGDVDVMQFGYNGSPARVWLSDGELGFTDFAAGLSPELLVPGVVHGGAAAGDIDGDGDLDVVVPGSGQVFVNHNAQTVANWLKVRLLTLGGVGSEFCATVTLVCESGCLHPWQATRVVDGGHSSQSSSDVHFGVPVPSATYAATVRYAGDARPIADTTTHSQLGGIVPAARSQADRLIIVGRVLQVTVLPWDFAGVTSRAGEPMRGPEAGDSVNITLEVQPALDGLVALELAVNGLDIAGTLVGIGNSTYIATFTTPAEDVQWPWQGLDITGVLGNRGSVVPLAQWSGTLFPGSTWSEESDARNVPALGSSNGVCMGDVDGDGDVDVFVASENEAQNQLWMNDGSGRFVDEAVAWNVAGDADDTSYGCSFGDADGDGLLDLMATRWNADADLLYMNTGSRFVEEGAGRGVGAGDNSFAASWGDVDGDGDVDLFVTTWGPVNRLYVNDGRGLFAEEGGARGVGTPRSSRQSALVDIDGDGDLDILVANYGANELFINDGTGMFEDAGATQGFNHGGNTVALSVEDWSGDGVVDVFVSNSGISTRDRLYLNDGSGGFAEVGVAHGAGGSVGHSRGVVTFDIENDGDLDVFVLMDNSADLVWVNGGGGGFSDRSADLALGSSTTAYCVSAGDIDGDGDVDIVMPRSGEVYVNHNAQPGMPRVFTVRPLTAGGAQSAFGAVARVECLDGCENDWVGVRVTDGGSGRYSQNGYDAAVGVPVPAATYNVSVRWAGDFHPPSNWTSHPGLGGVVPSTLTSVEDRLFIVRPFPVTVTVGGALPWDFPGVKTRAGEGAGPPTAGTVIEFPVVASPWGSTVDLGVVSGSLNGRLLIPTLTMGLSGNGTISFLIGEEDVDWPWGGVECSVTLADSGGLVSSNTSTFRTPGTTWSEESDTRGMVTSANSDGRGVCMGDVDGDGDVDVFVGMDGGTVSQLWVNAGSGGFTDEGIARGVAGEPSDNARGCGFGDADGDGWVDLVVTRYTDDVIELYMNDGGTFVEDGEDRGVSAGDNTVGVSWGDVDGDGDIDLFVCSFGQRNRLFMKDGAGVFAEDGVNRGVGMLTRTSWQSALVDIDGDGDLDILVVGDGANELNMNGGGGYFEEAGEAHGFADTSGGRGVSVGDWSGDGVVDVYVTNFNSRDLLLLNDGSGVFSEVGVVAGIGASTGYSYGVVMFDIENDGDVDVVVGVQGGSDFVWVNDGLGGFMDSRAGLALGSTLITEGVSAGDIDGDGDVDVIMGYSGDVYVSHSAQGGVGRVIVVRPLTAGGAQSAFGASVRVDCVGGCEDGWVGMRIIDGGSSYYSQSGYDAVLGVPVPSATYNVSVRWAGDFHPPSNWTSHPRLGGVVPSALVLSQDRLFVVRLLALTAEVGHIPPWDFPGVLTRTGQASSPPAAGDTVFIPIRLSQAFGTHDINARAAFVNGQNVRLTFSHSSPGMYTLEYTTVLSSETWPWTALSVEVDVVDSAGLASSTSAVQVPGNSFRSATNLTGLSTLPSSSTGLCVGDVDGDGDADIVVGVAGDEDLLLVNNGGVFAPAPNAFPGSAATSGCALGDVDGDGDLDVFFAVNGTDALFIQSPSLTFDEEASGRGLAIGGVSRSAVWGDVDADGDIDLFVCVSNGSHVLAVSDGSGAFSDGASTAGVATVTRCEQAVMVDVDGDTDLDILVTNGANADELFINLGSNSGLFVDQAASRGFNTTGDSRALSSADINGDGHVDIVVAQASSAAMLFVNDGDGVFSEEGAIHGLTQAVGTTGAVFLDIEHDGDVDMVLGSSGGLSAALWVYSSDGVFSDRSDDFNVNASSARVAVLDYDSDGDIDLVFSNGAAVYENFAADGGVANWLVVRPLTPAGGQSAFGAVVRLVCVEDCTLPWSGVRVIDGGSGFHGQQSYDAHFGLPVGGLSYDVSVVFVGGATHDKSTNPALGGVSPGAIVTVTDRPYFTDIVAAYSNSDSVSVGLIGVNDTVTITMTAAQRLMDLVPGPGCCLVNGVNVVESFVGGGDGSYNLTYVLGEGDGEWEAGALVVIPTLRSVGLNLSMIEVEFVLEDSPAGDPVSPVIEFGCRPWVASANVYEPICLSCPSESASCTFSYVVHSASLGLINAAVPADNYTSPTSASFFVGPFNDTDIAMLTVFAVDAAGNANASEQLSWQVDMSSPVTTLVTKPDPVTSRRGANFALQCSEAAPCTFEYRLNGGPLTALGGNTTVEDAPVVDTVMVAGPRRESPITAPTVSFAMTVSQSSMLANASVRVEVGSMAWVLPVVNNMTDLLQLPALGDGEHVLMAAGLGGDGTPDVTPITFVFTVDTVPPTISILDAPVDGARGNPTIVVDADEDECVFEWRAGPSPLNASWAVSSSAVIVPELTSSVPHTFEVRAIDPAGNVGSAVTTSWTPAVCPSTVPDVTVTSDVGVSAGQRYVTFEVVGGAAWDEFEYVVDDGDWVSLSTTTVIIDDVGSGGDHELQVRAAVPSECNSGLAASRPSPQLVTWTEPTLLPLLVTMQTKPDPSTPDVFAEFELLGSRRRAWFEYSLDGEPWTPTEALLRVGPLQAGSHTMQVRALDGDGVSGVDVQSHSWIITAASDSSIVLTNLPDGDHSLLVIATDEAGNLEVAPKTFEWRVDTTPPTITANKTSPRLSSSRTAVIDVSCGGEIDDCDFCWAFDGMPQNCSSTSPLLVTAPEDGYHAVDVRAVDSVGLKSTEGVDIEWTVDSTPPVVSVGDVDGVLVPARYDTVNMDAVVGNTSLRLNLTANEDVLWFNVTLNGFDLSGGRLVYPILELNDLPPIINNIVVSGTDLAGNMAEDVVLRVLVDVAPPQTLPFTTPPPSHTNAFSVTVGVACEDGASGVDGVEVSLLDESGDVVDVVVVVGASGSAVFGNLTSGVYNVTAVCVDVAGNMDDSVVVARMTVDHVPPVSEFGEAVPAFHPSPNLTVWMTATEDGELFARVVNLTTWQHANTSGAVTLPGLPDGSHVVELRSVDLAGNEELGPYVSASVIVDTVAPVLFWTTDVDGFTSVATVSRCFSANDSNPTTFSASPASAALHDDNCFVMAAADDGDVTVEITGTDAAGNVGDVATAWVLDRVPPSSAVVSSIVDSSPVCVHGDVTVCNASASAALTVACDDGDPSVPVSPCRPQYAVSLVEATEAVGCAVSTSTRRRLSTDDFIDAPTTSFTLDTVDGDGLYAVAVRSVDGAGNVEAGNTTLTWYVDTAAPVSAPTLVQTPDKVVSSTIALFVIQLSNDNSPGQTAFLYKLDDGPETAAPNLPSPNSASVQLEVTGLVDGDHKVEVWARDQAGNNGPFVLYDWAIATEAPGVNILSTPAVISADVTPSFVFQAVWVNGSASGSGVELQAGIEVSLSGDAAFTTVCEDTVSTGGVCVWNASLADRGEGTYTVNVRAVLGGNTGDPTPHTWSYTLCDDDQYAVIDGDDGIECFACPPGGDCSGRHTSQTDIAAVQGFWAPSGSNGLRFYECPVVEACLPGGTTIVGNSTLHVVSQCNEGYMGTLCAVCKDGFFEQFGLCVSCGTQSGVAWLVMLAVLVAVICVAVLFFKFRDLMPIDQLKVTLSMVQIIASANTAYAIPWPPLFADFLNAMRVFLVDAVSLTRANCAQPMTFYGSLTVTLVGFKVVLLVVVFGPVLLHKWKQRGHQHTMPPAQPAGSQREGAHRTRRRSSLVQSMVSAVHAAQRVDWAKIFKITFLFLFVAYPGVSLKIMKIFKCVEVEGDFWLVADMRLKCYEGDWYGYALYAFVMGCMYTGGLPLAITVILWRNRRRLGEEGVVAKWGFLYETYGVGAYLWEVVELSRKLWLSALVVLMEEGSPLQVTVAVLISGWAHVLHALYKPWRGVGREGTSVYVLQHGSLFVTCFVFLMGLLFKVEGVSQDGTTYTAVSWVMLLACVGFLLTAAFVLVTAVVTQLRKSRTKASLVGSSNSDRRTTRAAVSAWSGGALPTSTGDTSLGSRPGAVPRAVRASRMGAAQAGQMAWVGNPLKASEGKGAPNE